MFISVYRISGFCLIFPDIRPSTKARYPPNVISNPSLLNIIFLIGGVYLKVECIERLLQESYNLMYVNKNHCMSLKSRPFCLGIKINMALGRSVLNHI